MNFYKVARSYIIYNSVYVNASLKKKLKKKKKKKKKPKKKKT